MPRPSIAAALALVALGWAGPATAPTSHPSRSIVTVPKQPAATDGLAGSRNASTPAALLPTPSPANPITQPVILPAGLVSRTPILAQGDFLGGLGCAPTALSMVLGYFNAIDPSIGYATPQQLVGPNDFLPGQGVPYNNMVDSLIALGYRHIGGSTGQTFYGLKHQLESGPVIATVGMSEIRSRLIPGRALHSVVVVGIAQDNSLVVVNDPWTGKQITLAQAQFIQLWQGGQFGTATIRP